jgi:CobQ-like glutamine amidotransferase family enzyme
MVQVEILCTVITSQFGTLKTGDILRCNADFASHLVNEAFAAKYIQAAKEDAKPIEVLEVKKAKSKK